MIANHAPAAADNKEEAIIISPSPRTQQPVLHQQEVIFIHIFRTLLHQIEE